MSAKTSKNATTATDTTTPVPEKKKPGNRMYLGPTITGVVRHATVFKDGILPEKVKECVEQLPMMEKLFVAMEDISKSVKEIKKEQSTLRTIYTQVAHKFK